MDRHSHQPSDHEEPLLHEVIDVLADMSSILHGLLLHVRLPWLLRHYSRAPVLAIFSCITSCISIGLMTLIAFITRSPFIFPSLGPTAFLLFYRPTAPAASPRNTLIGHAIGVCAGYLSLVLTGLTLAGPALAHGVTESRIIAAAISLGLTTGLMVLLRTPHPPAAATTLIVSLGILTQPWQLLLLMIAVVLLIAQAMLIHRLAGVAYPLWSPRPQLVRNVLRVEERGEQKNVNRDTLHLDQNQQRGLPLHSSEASSIRYQVAEQIAQLCPLLLGQEIALTGLAALGVADEHSDIEMIFWVDTVPRANEREYWLYEIGAEDVVSDAEPMKDDSIWTTFRFERMWVEASWKTIASHEEQLRAILAGEVIDHDLLKLAGITVHAVPLRSQGLLSKWQELLASYPDVLQQKLIIDATEMWIFPHIVAARWALLQRRERMALVERLLSDTHNVLRLLFAINRQWEPDWKWISSATYSLKIQPERLVERINEVFSNPQPEQSIASCMQLIYDTLLLVPPQYNVTRVLATIRESLRTRD